MHHDPDHRLVEMIAETSGRTYHNTFVPRTGPSTSYVCVSRRQWNRCGRDVHVADSRTPSNGKGGSDLARLETAVPVDQRPATQLKELREAQLYSWVRIMRSGFPKQSQWSSHGAVILKEYGHLNKYFEHAFLSFLCRQCWKLRLT